MRDLDNEKEPTEEELEAYFKKLTKATPHLEERLELGRMLMKPIESFTEDELKRYNELIEITMKDEIHGR